MNEVESNLAKEITIDKSNYGAETLDRMNRLRHENVHCDFIIKVDSVEIPVHKVVVCANSDYFNAMLSHQETLESKTGIVDMKETDVESVKICIDFIYTGRAKFSYENAEGVFHNANMFQLKELCEGVVDFLSENLSLETFFHSKSLATTYSCKDLNKKCDEFALQHFEQIANGNDFFRLDKQYVTYLLKSKQLKVSEEVKLQAMIRWIKHDSEERKQHFVVMLKHVKLVDVPMSYRRYLVENEDLLKVSVECMMKFTISILDSSNVKARNYESASESKATGGHDILPSQGIGVYWERTSSIQLFNPSNKRWSDKQWKIPEAAGKQCTVLSLNDDIYVLSHNQSVHKLCYTGTNATWQRMQSMKYNHGSYPPAVVFDGLIYVVGGGWDLALKKAERYYQLHQLHNAIHNMIWYITAKKAERYNPASNTWTEIADCRKMIYGLTLMKTTNAIYKIGGKDIEDMDSSVVEKYNQRTGQWCNVASLNQPRSSAAAVTFNNKIYVFGDSAQNIECYDETNNTWTIVSGMDFPIRTRYPLRTSACVVNEEVYGCGSDNSKTWRIWKLNFENKSAELVGDTTEKSWVSIFPMKLVA